ncbi:DnaJ C-terminal domain-containing protein [Moraxella lincolnii]|uniref:DNA-binding protein n=1 Tax=Lwoffella lincolnii TaxID=90241 RepID=A0A1T0CJN1_9GAMM|nr:DnaJ C-terminal domain-containing protein [Moraxella lincolnii]OOS22535.1 DNA-binding protein [Moraxella lincolnii]
MSDKTHYDSLGVSKNATEADIKKAYRKLVRQYHPDVSDAPDADEKIAEINNAYETLKDKDKRAEYDAMLSNPFARAGGFGGTKSGGFGFGGRTQGSGFKWEDLKDQFGENSPFTSGSFRFDDILSAFGSGRRKSSQSGSAGSRANGFNFDAGFDPAGSYGFGDSGQDQHAEIEVELASVYTGDDYHVRLSVPTRGADGHIQNQDKTLKIKIPKGITEGKQIRLTGQGAVSLSGGSNGDLLLKVKIKQADGIRIDGADVYQTINVTPWQVALGEHITVQTPAGSFGVTIPAGSQSGSNLRLKGKGIPANDVGDLYLTLNITAPTIDNDAQRQAYEQLKAVYSH